MVAFLFSRIACETMLQDPIGHLERVVCIGSHTVGQGKRLLQPVGFTPIVQRIQKAATIFILDVQLIFTDHSQLMIL